MAREYDKLEEDIEEELSQNEKDNDSDKNKKSDPLRSFLYFMANYSILIFVIAYLIISNWFCVIIARGESMTPTIESNNLFLCDRTKDTFNHDDIIVIYTDEKFLFFKYKIIKRVIGVPGDTVYIKDGNVYVNDIMEENSFDKIIDPGILQSPVTLNEDEYIVLGDNRNNSKDSRIIGIINKENIVGRIIGQ